MREGENPADRMRTPAQRVHLSPPYSNRPHKERAILAHKLDLADRRAPITRGKQRVDLGAIDDKSGLVAGAARCDMYGMAIEPGIEQHDGAIDCHALRSVRGIGIGSAEPSSSAFVGDVGGNKADAAPVDDSFNTDVASASMSSNGRVGMVSVMLRAALRVSAGTTPWRSRLAGHARVLCGPCG
jgi:hypothetical protein